MGDDVLLYDVVWPSMIKASDLEDGSGLSRNAIIRDGCYICYRARLAHGHRRRERRRISRVLETTTGQTTATATTVGDTNGKTYIWLERNVRNDGGTAGNAWVIRG